MKIKSIEFVQVNIPQPEMKTKPRRPGWATTAEVANPMSRYAKVKRHRSLWLPKWRGIWVKVTLKMAPGVSGLWDMRQRPRPLSSTLPHSWWVKIVWRLIKLADMMFRMTKPYGSTGLASYAISAVDNALWDLKGKLLEQPVYSLLGGPQKDRIYCYATGNDVDWYKELGFTAFKLACPYGPADGLDGLYKNEEFIASVREIIGDESDLMLDCWMAFDVEYTVRLAEKLRPYRLKWMEECLISEDL